MHLIKADFQLTAFPRRFFGSLQSFTLLDRCENKNLESVEATFRKRIERKSASLSAVPSIGIPGSVLVKYSKAKMQLLKMLSILI